MTEIKQGYKQTDVGVIPDDWDVDKIKNFCSITTGNKNTQDRKETGHYPFFVRSSTVERIDSYSFDGEAVLTAGDGVGTGKIFHYINGKFDFHQRVYKMSHFNHRVSGFFFYKYFSNHFYDRIMSMTAKSSVDSVRMEMIAEMFIPLPKPTEQRVIAEALSDVDGLIESLEALVAKKRYIKAATMQQLLTGKKRLPGFDGEWEVKRIGECLDIRHGKSQKEVEETNGKNPILATGGIIGRTNAYLYNKPSVLIGRKGTINKPQYIDIAFWTVDTLFYSEIKDNTVPKFMFYKFCMIDWMKYNEASGVPSLSSRTVENIELLCPPTKKEQTAIAAILSDMDADIEVLEERLTKTRSLKSGMMQELLTGKTRLLSSEELTKVAA